MRKDRWREQHFSNAVEAHSLMACGTALFTRPASLAFGQVTWQVGSWLKETRSHLGDFDVAKSSDFWIFQVDAKFFEPISRSRPQSVDRVRRVRTSGCPKERKDLVDQERSIRWTSTPRRWEGFCRVTSATLVVTSALLVVTRQSSHRLGGRSGGVLFHLREAKI